MTTVKQLLSGQERGFGPSCIRGIAWLASKPYGAAIRVRNLGYDRGWLHSTKANVPVISIGNLTVGGTGKTPAVAMVCRYLRERDLRVSVISRGYGSVDGAQNDEALELELQLPDVPHIQNPNRVAAANIAIEELGTQIIVMDDGFQHRKLQRDLDIVLLDSTNPFGYYHLLPRGLLREQISSLRRAGLVIATRADQVDEQALAETRLQMQRFTTNCGWVEAVHQPRRLRNSSGFERPLSDIAGKKCILFCGIGNPQAFASSVKACGGHVLHLIEFPDHHLYQAADIESIAKEARKTQAGLGESNIVLLCTGKDLGKVNLDSIGEVPLFALDVGLEIRYGFEAFKDRMEPLIQAAQSIP